MRQENSSGEQSENNEQPAGGGASAFARALAQELAEEQQPGDTGSEDDDRGPPGESRKKGKPETIEQIAQALGVEVSELYSVRVPASAGRQAMTIGNIKDRFAEWDSLEADRLAFSEERVKQEGELERGRQEFRELLSLIPRDKLDAKLLQQIGEKIASRHRAQDAQVLTAIPEWKDEATRTAQRGELAIMLSGYGYTAAEANAIRDPRLLKFMRDAMRREKQVQAALAKIKPAQRRQAPANTATGAPRGEAPREPANTMRPTTGRQRFIQELRNPTR